MGVTAGAKLEPLYLFAYFNSIDLGTLGGGSSIPQINNKDIAPLIICLPPMALQKQFTAFVSLIDKLRVSIQASLDKTQQLFDSLMQEYFD
jgi:type I restriction enzyme S subunit